MARKKTSTELATLARDVVEAPRKRRRPSTTPPASITGEVTSTRGLSDAGSLANIAGEIASTRGLSDAGSLTNITGEIASRRVNNGTLDVDALANIAGEIGSMRRMRRNAQDRSLASIAAEIDEAPRQRRRPAPTLANIAGEIESARRKRRNAQGPSLASIAVEIASPTETAGESHAAPGESQLDLALPARPIAMELIAGRGHYERVLRAVLDAKVSVWIATANVKELMVEDHRARPGKRRSLKKRPYVSVLAHLDDLAARGVELRLLHAELPSGPFREEIARHPRLGAGGALALRRCPRVHLKAVIVDGELLYLGSANWTGAGLGAKGSGRRNFELGFVTDDAPLLDQIQALYERIWSGGECAACKLHDECPGPLAELGDAAPLVKIRSSSRKRR